MNPHVMNARKNVERTVKRMNELPIEVFKSIDELKLLSVRELKADLTQKRVLVEIVRVGHAEVEAY